DIEVLPTSVVVGGGETSQQDSVQVVSDMNSEKIESLTNLVEPEITKPVQPESLEVVNSNDMEVESDNMKDLAKEIVDSSVSKEQDELGGTMSKNEDIYG
ncbi:hypothetical protein KJ641_00460, partial [Patescibacteria group bacterium]|nr:hypothetical protein [Patescibacteria group bacterium]